MNKILILCVLLSAVFSISCAPVQKHNIKTDDEQFVKFIEQELATTHQARQQKLAMAAKARQQEWATTQAQLQELSTFQAEKQFYHLKVNTIPLNTIIKVMNIKESGLK